ncbi:MAG: hypothetical protein FWF60_00770 [Oscillospiraceae bacterium]|nr:hypothetical protein [Oscillospiraceae bacterium]
MKKIICICLAVCLLAGLFACDWSKDEPTAAVPTTAEAATTEFIPGSIRLMEARRIHESLPEFTFTLIGDPDEEDSAFVQAIVVIAQGFYQKLDVLESVSLDYWGDNGPVFADFNNDGYLDMQLIKYWNYMNSTPSIFWLWDNDARQFARNEQLEELSEESIISVEDDGRVRGYSRPANDDNSTSYYSYMDGAFVLVESKHVTREFDDDDNAYWIEEISKLVDGEMQVVSTTRTRW